MIIKGILTVLLLFLFYQDLRYRAIYWICFPFLLVLVVLLSLEHSDLSALLFNGGINTAFFILQLLILSMYFSIKRGKLINITKQYLGWGDVLFLIAITFCFSPLNYILFYISSLIIIMIIALMGSSKAKEFKVPLAGLQAIIFAAFLFADWNLIYIDLASDTWLISLLDL